MSLKTCATRPCHSLCTPWHPDQCLQLSNSYVVHMLTFIHFFNPQVGQCLFHHSQKKVKLKQREWADQWSFWWSEGRCRLSYSRITEQDKRENKTLLQTQHMVVAANPVISAQTRAWRGFIVNDHRLHDDEDMSMEVSSSQNKFTLMSDHMMTCRSSLC